MSESVRILGIEGTAWAASAAVYDVASDTVLIETDAYQPESGGIHPREATEHMHEAIPAAIERVLERAEAELDDDRRRGSTSEAANGTCDGVGDGTSEANGDHRRGSSGEASDDQRGSDRGENRKSEDGTRGETDEGHRDDGDTYSGTRGDDDNPPVPIDAVAFSRGPGLGPCLRIVATAARTVSQRLDVPLVGVNHMVAHLEIGRHTSGFDSPVCLNASGANAHLLAYRGGRYRVLGETMDTGVGNAIDKFTRHLGWSHPGGPKVEAAAADGEYVELPYVVKGMDFSFSGIMSAAKDAVDEGVPVEDVCFSLQETIFAMLTEVSERALSLTGSDELVLGGGVGQNDRLREMLAGMCDHRGASFHAPAARFLRDNAGMIAVLGWKQFAAGDTLSIEESHVDSDYRPDDVPVTWREAPDERADPRVDEAGRVRGAEAVVELDPAAGVVVKRRLPKTYRHPALDERLRRERTRLEARLTALARREGVPTPVIRDVDQAAAELTFEYVGDSELRETLSADRVRDVGRHLARLHRAGFVHGDPTTRNVRVDAARTYLVDFGLGFHTDHVEDYAMDLHVLDQSLIGTAADPEPLFEAARAGYREVGDDAVLDRLADVEGRGRYVGENGDGGEDEDRTVE